MVQLLWFVNQSLWFDALSSSSQGGLSYKLNHGLRWYGKPVIWSRKKQFIFVKLIYGKLSHTEADQWATKPGNFTGNDTLPVKILRRTFVQYAIPTYSRASPQSTLFCRGYHVTLMGHYLSQLNLLHRIIVWGYSLPPWALWMSMQRMKKRN